MSPASAPADGLGSVARGGSFAFLGSIVSAVMGLLLVVVLGRSLGPEGSGLVFQGIAAFTIAMSVARFGLDTTAVWLLPRLRIDSPGSVRGAVAGLLLPALALGLLGWAVLALLAHQFGNGTALAQILLAMAWALPAAGVTMVGLAVTRALGGVRTFVTVQNIAIPTARPALAWAVVAGGGAATGVALSWVAPFAAAAVIALVVVVRQLNSSIGPVQARARAHEWRPTRTLNRTIFAYSFPRAVSAALDEAMRWLDVLIVGVLAGPAAAGVYGAATRFTNAGMILMTSLRIVVAPMYSKHLGTGDMGRMRTLYSGTTAWIIAFSVPIYLTLALFGGSVIGLLGTEFRDGAVALAILALGMVLVVTAGNIQSVLLMSGLSSVAALNKVVAVATNVLLLLLLVPTWGIVGAAVAWVVAMAVDTCLAMWQVTRRVGVRPWDGGVLRVLLVTILTFGLPALILRLSIGDSMAGLVAGAAVGAVALSTAMWVLKELFQLDGLTSLISARKGK